MLSSRRLLWPVFLMVFNCQAVMAAPLELSLNDSISLALKNNPVTRIAAYEREKSAWALKQATAAKSFSIDFTLNDTRTDKPPSYLATLNPVRPYNYFLNQLTVTLPLYSGGKLERSIDKAGIGLTISDLTVAVKRQQLKYEVTAAYYHVLETCNLLAVAGRATEDYAAHLELVEKQYAAGMVALPDVLQTKVRLANARDELFRAQNNYHLAVYDFNTLLGIPIHSEIKLGEELQYSSYTITQDGCLAYALQNRPEMAQTAANVKLTKAQVEIAQSGRRPKVDLDVVNYWDDTEFAGTDHRKWAVGIAAKWNVFDAGLVGAEIRQAEYALAVAKEQARQTQDAVTLEVTRAYQTMAEAEKRIETSTVAVEQAELDLKLSQERYAAGMGTNLDVLDAELARTKARTNYVQALYDFNTGKAQVEKAMGVPADQDLLK